MTSIGRFVFLTGGTDLDVELKTVDTFDLKDNKWRRIADMNERRCDHKSATLNSLVYVVGGQCMDKGKNETTG